MCSSQIPYWLVMICRIKHLLWLKTTHAGISSFLSFFLQFLLAVCSHYHYLWCSFIPFEIHPSYWCSTGLTVWNHRILELFSVCSSSCCLGGFKLLGQRKEFLAQNFIWWLTSRRLVSAWCFGWLWVCRWISSLIWLNHWKERLLRNLQCRCSRSLLCLLLGTNFPTS